MYTCETTWSLAKLRALPFVNRYVCCAFESQFLLGSLDTLIWGIRLLKFWPCVHCHARRTNVPLLCPHNATPYGFAALNKATVWLCAGHEGCGCCACGKYISGARAPVRKGCQHQGGGHRCPALRCHQSGCPLQRTDVCEQAGRCWRKDGWRPVIFS